MKDRDRVRALLRARPVAYLVESSPGRVLRDAEGCETEALVFLDLADAGAAVAAELRDHGEGVEPIEIIPLVPLPSED